jgi:hypothetical protein
MLKKAFKPLKFLPALPALAILAVALTAPVPGGYGAGFWGGNDAFAQKKQGRGLGALSQLQNNPRYRGRVLGTHVFRTGPGQNSFLYEVRILTPDDRVILVYVDPATGRVVRDTAGTR